MNNLVLLQLKTEEYLNIAGIKISQFNLNNQLIDNSNISSGRWRNLMVNAGLSRLTIKATGLFTNHVTERIIMLKAFNNESLDLRLCFTNGDLITGKFLIGDLERAGGVEEEENYSLSLEACSEIFFEQQEVKK